MLSNGKVYSNEEKNRDISKAIYVTPLCNRLFSLESLRKITLIRTKIIF